MCCNLNIIVYSLHDNDYYNSCLYSTYYSTLVHSTTTADYIAHIMYISTLNYNHQGLYENTFQAGVGNGNSLINYNDKDSD